MRIASVDDGAEVVAGGDGAGRGWTPVARSAITSLARSVSRSLLNPNSLEPAIA